MLRKFFLMAAMALVPAAVSQAAFDAGDWDLTLGGSGYHGPDMDGVSAYANVQLGYFLSKPVEVGVRQAISFNDFGVGSDIDGSTVAFLDYHFYLGDKGQWVPFVGLNAGYIYGDSTIDTWTYGPEAGLKYFVNTTTYVYLMAQYQFYCDDGAFNDDGEFVYSLGLGVRL